MAAFEKRVAQGDLDDSDDALVEVVRKVAADRKLGAAPRTGWRAAIARVLSEEGTCAATPGLLAARARGSGEPADRDRLDEHLSRCLTCRATDVRWRRAERAFAATLKFAGAVGAAAGDEALAGTAAAAAAPDTAAIAAAPNTPAAPAAPNTPAASAAPVAPAPSVAPAATATAATDATAALVRATSPRRAPPGSGGHRRRLAGVPVHVLIALAVLCVVAVVVVATSGSSHGPAKSVTQDATRHPATTPATPTAPPKHAVRNRAKAQVAHHTRTRHHTTPKPRKPAPARTASRSPQPAPTSPHRTPAAAAPAPVARTPVASSRQPSAPASSPSAGSGGGSSTASIQQPSLGSASAPTQGISSSNP